MEYSINSELIRGRVDTIILRSLEEQDRYGYEILDIICSLSDGKYAIKQPTLYSCLKRLEKFGFISSYLGDESNGARRRYYQLTQKGRNTLEQDQREWEYSRTILDKLLSDRKIDLKTADAPFDATDLKPYTKRVKAYDIPEKGDISPALYATIQFHNKQTPAEQPLQAAQANQSAYYTQLQTVRQEIKQDLQIPSQMQPQIQPQTPSQTPLETQRQQLPADAATLPAQPSAPTVQNLVIDGQKQAAARLLQIGEYAISAKDLIGQQVNLSFAQKPSDTAAASFNATAAAESNTAKTEAINAAKPSKIDILSYKSENNYKDILAPLFGKPSAAAEGIAPLPAILAPDIKTEDAAKSKQLYDIKQSLESEGYKLKIHSKTNAISQYYLNYIFRNRLIRDTSFLLYLTVIIELVLLFIGRKIFGYTLSTLIPIGVIALIIPAAGGLNWTFHPYKRSKARFNFSTSLINSIVAYILIVALCAIIYLVSPFVDIGLDDGRMYVPFVLAANIPIYVLIYNFLYKSKHYHLK